MKPRKNPLPIAPFNLRETGPIAQAKLTKKVGFFRFAHGVGADRRATIDRDPCPHCKGKVEWTLTYKREGAEVVPYIYARCRSAPKSHRWDFTHWVKPGLRDLVAAQPRMAASVKRPSPPVQPPAPKLSEAIPAPRPSVGTDLMVSWLDKRLDVLTAEVDKLMKIRQLTADVAKLEGVAVASPPRVTPGNGDHTKH
jgi:hypothetical protein